MPRNLGDAGGFVPADSGEAEGTGRLIPGPPAEGLCLGLVPADEGQRPRPCCPVTPAGGCPKDFTAPSPLGNVVNFSLMGSHRQTFLQGANNYCKIPVLTSVIFTVLSINPTGLQLLCNR